MKSFRDFLGKIRKKSDPTLGAASVPPSEVPKTGAQHHIQLGKKDSLINAMRYVSEQKPEDLKLTADSVLSKEECEALAKHIRTTKLLKRFSLAAQCTVDDFAEICRALYENASILELSFEKIDLIREENKSHFGKMKPKNEVTIIATGKSGALVGVDKFISEVNLAISKDYRNAHPVRFKNNPGLGLALYDVKSNALDKQIPIVERNRSLCAAANSVPAPVAVLAEQPSVPVVAHAQMIQHASHLSFTTAESRPQKVDADPTSLRVPTSVRVTLLALTLMLTIAVRILDEFEQVNMPFDFRIGDVDAMYFFRWGLGITSVGLFMQTAFDDLVTVEKTKTKLSLFCDGVLLSGLALLFTFAAGVAISEWVASSEGMDSPDLFTKHLFTGLFSGLGALALGTIASEGVSACGNDRDSIRGRFSR